MFDVLPPTGQGSSGNQSNPRRARLRRPQVSSVPPRRLINPGPRTVQINWKLPARLRKPIRDQFKKERQKKRERQAIIRFERHPINTRPVLTARPTPQRETGGINLPRHRLFNRGAEHHTGDTYKDSRPQLKMAAPPYVGSHAIHSFVRPAAAGEGARESKITRKLSDTARINVRRGRKTDIDLNSVPISRRVTGSSPLPSIRPSAVHHSIIASERDVPFDWNDRPDMKSSSAMFVAPADNQPAVNKPRWLPFRFTIWPKFFSFGRSIKSQDDTYPPSPSGLRGVTRSTERVKKKSDQRTISG